MLKVPLFLLLILASRPLLSIVLLGFLFGLSRLLFASGQLSLTLTSRSTRSRFSGCGARFCALGSSSGLSLFSSECLSGLALLLLLAEKFLLPLPALLLLSLLDHLGVVIGVGP